MWRASLLVLAACGRFGFDRGESGDAATDTFRPAPALVQTTSADINSTRLVIPLQTPTRAGDLLVVMSGCFLPTAPAEALTGVNDDAGNAYRSANALASWKSGDDLVEIWYAPNSRPGATTVTLMGTQAQNREGWFLEVSGLDPVAPLDTVSTTTEGPSTMMPTAPPVAVASAGSLVVGLADVTNAVTGLAAGSPFVALPSQFGNDAAYTFAQTPGTYAAVWDDSTAGGYSAATAVFKP